MIIWYMSAYDQPLGKSSRTYDFSIQLSNMGHEVTMFTNSYCHWSHIDILGGKERSKIEEINGIKVVWLKTYPYSGNGLKRGINMITNVFRSLQVEKTINQKPDIIIGPSVPIGTGWAAFRIAKKYNIPFVYEVRDVWPIALVDDGGLSKNNPIYFIFRLIEKTLYKQSVKISSTLRFLQKHVKESGSDPEKIEWIPNGVDFSRFNNCAKYNGGDKNAIKVMYIGGFGQAHDVITLVKCAKLFNDKKDTRFNFTIIGDGPKKGECVEFSIRHKLLNIEFRDSVEKSEIPKLQEKSDILIACVLDSKIYRFGLNLNKVYDYMASARPVILSAEVVDNPITKSKSGYVVKPENPLLIYNALCEYIDLTPNERKAMGENGFNYVKNHFNMKILGEKMSKTLIDAVNIFNNRK
jgi:glycosyltransferase involved in cell wall biosynthesis